MAKRVARKIKRAGKRACQFKFTSTFEYIDLECKGAWRPDNLKVIWLRSHRRAQSMNVEWVCMEDQGPNGASGRAVFDPPISASLIVTLYKDSKKPYEEKEYKYYIENEGPAGKKILASFTCDMAEYAGIPSSRHALEMNFKPISSKIKKCYLGITLESEFVKEGNANDDDMQSTFSAVEPGGEEMVFADEVEDEDDDDDLDEAATLGKKTIKTDETEDVQVSLVLLGTGQTLKRTDIDRLSPPPKPPRASSVPDLLEGENDGNIDRDEDVPSSQGNTGTSEVDKVGEKAPFCNNSTDLEPICDASSKLIDESYIDRDEDAPLSLGNTGTSEVDKAGEKVPFCNNSSDLEPICDVSSKLIDESCANDNSNQSNQERITIVDIPTTNNQQDSAVNASFPEEAQVDKTIISSAETVVHPNEKVFIQTDQDDLETYLPDKSVSDTQSNFETENTDQTTLSDQQESKEPKTEPEEQATADVSESPAEIGSTPADSKPEDQSTKDEEPEETTDVEPPPSSEDELLPWLPDIELVDHTNNTVSKERIASADVLAFYFSASWCPPCKTFLPNLKKFYTALKDNNKSFEMIYVSSDYSSNDMDTYMSETTMPWTAIRYGHKLADKLRQDYKVRVIPILVIVSQSGKLLEENAKKQVDKAVSASSSTAACIQLYSKWFEKIANPFSSSTAEDEEEPKQKTGVLNTLKKVLSKDEPSDKNPLRKGSSADEQSSLRETAESKVPKSKINSGGNKEELIKQLQEKENVIRQLEEVNLSLKHTNDDLNNEVRNLKSKVELLNDEVLFINNQLKSIRESNAKNKEEDEMFKEYLKLQGWLFKRGIKGPTANKWRRRYFRLDQGSKLYYYKSHTEGTPQGHIDLLKVISVMELSTAQQDKNNASFNVECEGRTYQLQAYDEAEMRRWITAIDKLKEFYHKQEKEAKEAS